MFPSSYMQLHCIKWYALMLLPKVPYAKQTETLRLVVWPLVVWPPKSLHMLCLMICMKKGYMENC